MLLGNVIPVSLGINFDGSGNDSKGLCLPLPGMPNPQNMTRCVAKGELATTSSTEINKPK